MFDKKEYNKNYKQSKKYKDGRKLYKQSEHGKRIVASVSKRYRDKRKLEVIQYYGGKCECCGEFNIKFLTIDHVKGGGNKHRKQLGVAGSSFYSWLIKNEYPKGFRVLCFQCNCAIGIYGICPHEEDSENFKKF
jgi:hypothetical protein